MDQRQRLLEVMTTDELKRIAELEDAEAGRPLHEWQPGRLAELVRIYASANERLPAEHRVVPLED